MANRKVDKTQKSGAEGIRDRGEVGILIAVSPELRQKIKTAAVILGKPMNHFIRDAAENAASHVIEQFKGT